ncbi:MAG: hypothetical protein ABFD63_03340 [Smithella sp.]
MKRIIMSTMVLLMLLASIGGCFVPWYEDGRDGRDGGHQRDSGYDRGPGHDRDRGPGGPEGHDRDGRRY